jgi:hypothetical protein
LFAAARCSRARLSPNRGLYSLPSDRTMGALAASMLGTACSPTLLARHIAFPLPHAAWVGPIAARARNLVVPLCHFLLLLPLRQVRVQRFAPMDLFPLAASAPACMHAASKPGSHNPSPACSMVCPGYVPRFECLFCFCCFVPDRSGAAASRTNCFRPLLFDVACRSALLE